MGLIWGMAWLGAGLILMLGLLVLTGETGADVPYPLGFGMFGFIAGVAFSGLLGLVESRRRFEEMSVLRFAAWGAGGGLLLALGFVTLISLIEDPSFFQNLRVLGPVFSIAGAGSAAGALALARGAKVDGLIEADEEPERLGASRPPGPLDGGP